MKTIHYFMNLSIILTNILYQNVKLDKNKYLLNKDIGKDILCENKRLLKISKNRILRRHYET